MTKSISYRAAGLAGAALLAAFSAAAPAAAQVTPREREGAREGASPHAESYPVQAVGDGNTVGGYNQSRWAEDWSKYRDPAKRDDPIDALKFIPIDGNGDVYVTLSGELRLRVNHTTNPNLRESEAQRQDINRIALGADVHVGPNLRFFGELAHGGIAGENLGNVPANLRNDLVVQQAFAEVSGDVGGVDLGLRYGRQTFADGPNLMVVPRDNNTIFYTLNGFRGWARTATARIDAFDLKPTSYGYEGLGDDRTSDAERFSGVTLGFVVPQIGAEKSKLYFDPFFWRLRRSAANWGGISAREERKYIGAHLWGDVGPLTIDWTLNHQGGDFDGRKIDAWQLLMAQTYALKGLPLSPRVGFHADLATGGGSYTGGKLATAYSPFGNNVYYSYQLFLTPTNLRAIAPNVTVTPVKGVRATLEYQWAWRDNERDAVYRANGTAFAGTQLVPGSKVADSLRAQVVWTITPRVSFTGRYEHLNAGPVLTRAGYADSDFLAGWLSFRF